MADRDLCTIDDVVGYVPAFDPDDSDNESIVAKLEALITAQSQLILSRTGRELVALEPDQPAVRTFPIGRRESWRRQIEIGDLATTDDLELRLLASDRTLAAVVADGEFIAYYGDRENPRESWDPITSIAFPLALGGPSMIPGQALEITGTWGFPEIPAFVVEACAGRVILRYLNDVANAGNAFSEAIENVNLDGLFQSSEDALAELETTVYA